MLISLQRNDGVAICECSVFNVSWKMRQYFPNGKSLAVVSSRKFLRGNEEWNVFVSSFFFLSWKSYCRISMPSSHWACAIRGPLSCDGASHVSLQVCLNHLEEGTLSHLIPRVAGLLRFFFFFFFFVFIWRHWVLIAMHGLSLVAASGGYSLALLHGFLIAVASPVAEHGL